MSLKDGVYSWQLPKQHKEKRSIQQNNYYFGVVCKIISDETGYTTEEIHQILGDKFLSYEKNELKFIKSTTKLKTNEFEIYMEECRRFASMELSCYVPLPNEPNNFYYDLKRHKT
ncbi:MAG: hypothetical protein GY941_23630 [Planctomycetes bacterium]|nr:hypothetical protein [Planctomycetota bacterium]